VGAVGSDELSLDEDDDDSSNALASECLDSDLEETEEGQRVIFPWMKKIHVAGVGECSCEKRTFSSM
jgi:hypothetical protein